MISAEETANFEIFRDCLSAPLIQKFAGDPAEPKRKRRSGHGKQKSQVVSAGVGVDDNSTKDAEELSEFIDYIATEIFTSLPPELRTLTYTAYTHSSALRTRYSPPSTRSLLQNLDPDVTETLSTYAQQPADEIPDLLAPVLASYVAHTTTAPLPPSLTKALAAGCEICAREHVPLTYHHLIPKMVHDKALKRGWHGEEALASVAWLCRACHGFVHRCWGHEVLARELFTVERLVEREEVRRWAGWVGRVRWGAR